MILHDLLKDIGEKRVTGDQNIEIKGITVDSNKVEKNFMFIAIKGTNTDGHKYIQSAISNGANAIMFEDNFSQEDNNISLVEVENTRKALPKIASNFYSNPTKRINLVGITGTNGKTTISYILEQIWKEQGVNSGIIGTIENRFKNKIYPANLTTPDPIGLNSLIHEMKDDGVTHIAMEVSSHALDLSRVDSCDFDVAIFSNLTQDHLDYHKTLDNYFNAKKKLFIEVLKDSKKENKYSIINIDDEYGKKLSEEIEGKVITYSTIDKNADIYADNVKISNDNITADVLTIFGNLKLKSNLIGKHNLYNLLAATGGALSLNCDIKTVENALNKVDYIPGRLEKITNSLGLNVFVDYAHTPDALKNVIFSIRSVYKGKLITVFGCGGDRDKKKRPLMGSIAEEFSDLVVVTSDNPRTENPELIIEDIKEGFKSKSELTEFVNREKAIEYAINTAKKDDTILIAGKGHEDYQILGKEKIFFDDRLIAKKYLELKEEKNEI